MPADTFSAQPIHQHSNGSSASTCLDCLGQHSLTERATPGWAAETGKLGTKRDEPGEPGTDGGTGFGDGDRREVSPTPKPPIVMSQTSLVKQTSESVPPVLGLPVRARR